MEAAKQIHSVAQSYYDMQVLPEESEKTLAEDFHLNRVTHVHHDPASKEFAKRYTNAHRGGHRAGGGLKLGDNDHEEKFHADYGAQYHRSGFAGSGETHYTHKTTGEKYAVKRYANGETFHGTNHSITKLS